jgi:hypothetical protein
MPLSDNARSPGAVDRRVRTPPAFGSNTDTMAGSMGRLLLHAHDSRRE